METPMTIFRYNSIANKDVDNIDKILTIKEISKILFLFKKCIGCII